MMKNTSKPIFIYLQRPDTGEWMTVGRYRMGGDASGWFKYAPSYVDAGCSWSIDPVNLPFVPEREVLAPRYHGLHDVLRDACPDAWGQALLRKEYNLPADAPPLQYLLKAGNTDRWGALAAGHSAKFSAALLASPPLPTLAHLVEELIAMAEGRPTIRASLRKKLIQTASVGGARPKATVRDEQENSWLVKPRLATDVADIPRLEHVAQTWGGLCGLNFAPTVLHDEVGGRSAVRVLRFDRSGRQRHLCVSAAALLQAEYPDNFTQTELYSYPRLADELRRIGAPLSDQLELYGRMIFNAVCGNDDDHIRNHAVVYRHQERRWRLAPAFDVVPNPVETPHRLHMQLALGRFEISREAALADAHRFGLTTRADAEAYLEQLLQRIRTEYSNVRVLLDPDWSQLLHARMEYIISLLMGQATPIQG